MDFSPLGLVITGVISAFGAVKFYGKTYLEETIKADFERDLEKFKAELSVEVSDRIEPFRAGLAVLTNRQDVIFNLEKEALVEFNENLNKFLWQDMDPSIPLFTFDNFELITERLNRMNSSYQKAQIGISKIQLIVENDELVDLGRTAVTKCLNLKHFIDEKFNIVYGEIKQQKWLHSSFLDTEEKIQNMIPAQKGELIRIMAESEDNVKKALKDYREKYLDFSGPAMDGIRDFLIAARSYIKNKP